MRMIAQYLSPNVSRNPLCNRGVEHCTECIDCIGSHAPYPPILLQVKLVNRKVLSANIKLKR